MWPRLTAAELIVARDVMTGQALVVHGFDLAERIAAGTLDSGQVRMLCLEYDESADDAPGDGVTMLCLIYSRWERARDKLAGPACLVAPPPEDLC